MGDAVEIDRLAVHPDHFRPGIARTLLSELHRREANAARFEVATGAGNGPARPLYGQLGYRRAGEDQIGAVRIVRLVR